MPASAAFLICCSVKGTAASRNIGFVNIANAGINYSNGYINFQNASGTGANAQIVVNSIGSIVSVVLNNRGINYNSTDTIFANVANLLTYNIATITIANTGSGSDSGSAGSNGTGYSINYNSIALPNSWWGGTQMWATLTVAGGSPTNNHAGLCRVTNFQASAEL
jgi:hypothetical protein